MARRGRRTAQPSHDEFFLGALLRQRISAKIRSKPPGAGLGVTLNFTLYEKVMLHTPTPHGITPLPAHETHEGWHRRKRAILVGA
jgi:hypothetical protein